MATNFTIAQLKTFLKSLGLSHTFTKKDIYEEKVSSILNVLQFPWREDQQEVIDEFLRSDDNLVINGIFGCGKTTLLFGLLINGVYYDKIKPEDVIFVSFNISIRNELKSKLRKFGFKNKVAVRTFDSLIYQICRDNGYPHLKLPNFTGKRLFCFDLKEDCIKPECQKKLFIIDEVQDLDNKDINILRKCFPNTRFIMAGDVFQSIQKEPRESMLWHILNNEPDFKKFHMRITPRVPTVILSMLQGTLTEHYPEFEKEIQCWKSTNPYSDATIEWKRFYSYVNIYDTIEEFIDEKGFKDTMVLTFSSSRTVTGKMGDVARFRNNLNARGIMVNQNHKKFEEDKLFLSTANSSKGLERDHVLAVLTFPLERAFINFSNDLVMNLITVAVTRAKKSVTFYVPGYEDKYTDVCRKIKDCPLPNKSKIREGKILSDFTFSDYFDMEHGVTECIKQSIVSYDNRVRIKEFIKCYETSKVFPEQISAKRPILITEEDRAAMGILIENLITSTWANQWPMISDIEQLRNHPMYFHIFKKIEKNYKIYSSYIKQHRISKIEDQFNGIYMYSQLHISIYNKMYINFGKEIIQVTMNYWRELKQKIIHLRPENTAKIMIQPNLRMPWLTGIADVIFRKKDDNSEEINVWELKASISPDWKDNALTQAFLYSLMTGKSWSRITLLNPFRNEKCSYHFNSREIMTLRNIVYSDLLLWNMNCFLAKNFNNFLKNTFVIRDKWFVYYSNLKERCPYCKEIKDISVTKCKHFICSDCFQKGMKCSRCETTIEELDKPPVCQVSIIELFSPTKAFIRKNQYFNIDFEEEVTSRQAKLVRESKTPFKEVALDKECWYSGDLEIKEGSHLKNIFPHDVSKIEELSKYKKNEELSYSLDFKDGLVNLMTLISLISKQYKLVY